jgi:hypothetical protein
MESTVFLLLRKRKQFLAFLPAGTGQSVAFFSALLYIAKDVLRDQSLLIPGFDHSLSCHKFCPPFFRARMPGSIHKSDQSILECIDHLLSS